VHFEVEPARSADTRQNNRIVQLLHDAAARWSTAGAAANGEFQLRDWLAEGLQSRLPDQSSEHVASTSNPVPAPPAMALALLGIPFMGVVRR
jgi:hypothetical protein